MEEKIIQAIKIISNLGEDFDELAWHKACIEILNLGLNEKSLKNFIGLDYNKSLFGDFRKGNHYVAANYIRNFIMKNDNLPYVKEIMFMTKDYLKAIEAKGESI